MTSLEETSKCFVLPYFPLPITETRLFCHCRDMANTRAHTSKLGVSQNQSKPVLSIDGYNMKGHLKNKKGEETFLTRKKSIKAVS